MSKINPGIYVNEFDYSSFPQREDLIKGAWQAFIKKDNEKLEYISRCDRNLNGSIANVRRVFPELIVNDLVGVQPMTESKNVGMEYILRYRYVSGDCPPNAIVGAWKDFCNDLSTTFWSSQDRDNVKRHRTIY